MAAEFTPKAGDTVYSSAGHRAEYIAERDGLHIVLPFMRADYDDEPPWPGEPEAWHEVYEKPPVPVVHEDVAEARAELDALLAKVLEAEQQLRTMRDERAQLQRDQAAVRERLKENDALRNIDAFLAGSITHFITDVDSAPDIKTYAAVIENEDRYKHKELRLLGLFGGTSRGVRWKVTVYGDGSGSQSEVIPCLSMEDAEARARALLTEKTFPALRSGQLSLYYGSRVVDLAKRIGVEVPADIAEKVANDRRELAVKLLQQAKTDSERAAKQLADAEAAARSAGVVEGSGSHG